MKAASRFFTVVSLSLLLIACGGDTQELSAEELEEQAIRQELEELESRVKR